MAKLPHLSKKDTEDILRFLTLARSYLRLDQWDVILMKEPPEEDDVVMEVTPQANHFTTQLRVCKDWAKQPDSSKRDTIIHELLHLLHRDISDVFDDATYGNTAVSVDACGLINQRWTLAEERVVSHLSKLLADGWDQRWPAPASTQAGRGIYIEGEHR